MSAHVSAPTTNLYSDLQSLTFDSVREKPKNRGPLVVTHNRDQDACLKLAHTILLGTSVTLNDTNRPIETGATFNYKEGYQRFPDELNHCHYSLELLKEEYDIALASDKEELVCFMLKVYVIGDKVLACHKMLKIDIALAEGKLTRLRQDSSRFYQEKNEVKQELKACEEEREKLTDAWALKLAKEANRIQPFRSKDKKAQDLQAIVEAAKQAHKPLFEKEKVLKERLKSLDKKSNDIPRIEEVVRLAVNELKSHADLLDFVKSTIEKHPPESFVNAREPLAQDDKGKQEADSL